MALGYFQSLYTPHVDNPEYYYQYPCAKLGNGIV